MTMSKTHFGRRPPEDWIKEPLATSTITAANCRVLVMWTDHQRIYQFPTPEQANEWVHWAIKKKAERMSAPCFR